MNLAARQFCAWKVGVNTRSHCMQSAPLVSRRLCTSLKVGAAPQDGLTANSSNEIASPAAKSTGDLANEVLRQALKSEATTTQAILGEDVLANLRAVLGSERARVLIGVLDAVLANRRAATLILAVLDVALIWVLVKVFRTATTHE
ncbi:hypothetical protein Vretimale_11408 [Volvox reticuliferus]|uniref:Uncharacterized protein n=1 Tax=Volvox reticuliferus TaxID=1737510 RepID=A0A8J4CJS9_9CHLO|nr:hypothetical protein Vretifemale_11916 [Volvox reticuliferus]GIM07300.1 hypothetical protein Vretimale_11408 [Volvox reticuliferus]